MKFGGSSAQVARHQRSKLLARAVSGPFVSRFISNSFRHGAVAVLCLTAFPRPGIMGAVLVCRAAANSAGARLTFAESKEETRPGPAPRAHRE
jgi:hypothetical protein